MILTRTQVFKGTADNHEVVSRIEEPSVEPLEGLISFLNTECRHCDCSQALPHLSMATYQSVQSLREEWEEP